MSINLLIATPAFGGNVCSDYTKSLLFTCILLSQKGIQFDVQFINNQLVTRARNMLCSIFMNNEQYTHMIFIDADVVWDPRHVLMLLEHDLECVIGVYANKGYYWKDGKLTLNPSSQFESNAMLMAPPPNKHLVRISLAATGFMLFKKSALLKIQNDVETFYLPKNGNKELIYNYFDCRVVDQAYLTEDYYFSYLFRKNGGEIFADNRIVLGHIGPHEYGSLLKSQDENLQNQSKSQSTENHTTEDTSNEDTTNEDTTNEDTTTVKDDNDSDVSV